MKSITILVSSAGRRVELIECFRRSARELGFPIKVIACDVEPGLSAACNVADLGVAVSRCDRAEFVDELLAIVRENDVRLVIPTIDPELGPLSAAVPRFAELGARVHVSPPAVIDIARDKLRTARVLATAGVPVPLTILPHEAKSCHSVRWPMFLKPAGGSASRGISIIRNAADLPAIHSEPMVLQQLLDGPEFTVNMFIDQYGHLRSVVPHRRLRVRAGEVEKGRTERNPEFDRIARAVAQALPGAAGALCFQLIADKETGPRVFEINARFGGGYPLAHHAGAAFAKWLLEEITDLPSSASDDWREGVLMLRYDAAVFPG
jgi:carbamoyl-phosphate synthase large subunit